MAAAQARLLYMLWLLTVLFVISADAGASRQLLQSGTSCPNQIPGCMPRRCTTRTVAGLRNQYVCLRCKAGMRPVTLGNSIIQCICNPGTWLNNGLCQPCDVGFYCPGGWRKASKDTDDMGKQYNCNPNNSTGFTTKGQRATSPADCNAMAGYALPLTRGGPAQRCTGATYSPPNNRLSTCLRCQSGLLNPPTLTGLNVDRLEICQVPPGRFWELNVVRDCPKGLYRSNFVKVTEQDAISCLPCPPGWTTPGIATADVGFCNTLVAGWKVGFVTAGASVDPSTVLPMSGDPPPEAEPCPVGFYFTGDDRGVWGCKRCPHGAITRQNGSISLDDCQVPPGYYIEAATDTLQKCPNNVSGNGYFRQGWISYSLGIDSGNGTTVCTPCGEGILSRPKEFDEAEALMAAFKSANNQTLDDYQGLVAASGSSCYIEAGWGITFDPQDFRKFKAIIPCPRNTYGVSNETFGLMMVPCKACTKNLRSPAGSTSFMACVNPAGFGYNSEGANQCADGFYSEAQKMQPCIQCPPGRTTLYIAGNGTFQNTIDDCLVIPGHGVFSSTAANPWNPTTRSSSQSAQPCPLGFFSVGDATTGIRTQNPVCQKCAVNQFTLDVGSQSCDVCNAGFGIPITSASSNTSECDTCLYGSYSFGDSTGCSDCPNAVFNHRVGPTFVSYGMTFYPGMVGPETCVPRYSQLAPPAGAIMSLHESMFTSAGQSNLGDCVRSCPVDSCCVAQWEALNNAETVGDCRQVIMPPAAPDTTTAKLYYKLPPAGLIAAASLKNVSASSELQTGSGLKVSAASLQVAGKVDEQGRVVFDGSVGPTRSSPDAVKAKTISSGLYARCSVAQWASLAENGFMGTSPFPEDIEKDATYIQYNVQCNSEASCKQFCDSLSTCWGFVFVPGRGFAIRGGEDRLEVRTFFAVPDPNKPPGFNLSALQW